MKKSAFLVAAAFLATVSHFSPLRAQTGDTTTGQSASAIKKPAAQLSPAEIKNLGQGISFPYDLLENVLKRFVDAKGNVAYARAKGDNDLEIYVRAVALAELGAEKFPVFQSLVDEEKPEKGTKPDDSAELAFWINAYNALRIKAIADAYPVNSLTQIKGLETDKTRVVGGQSYSFAELRAKIGAFDGRALFVLMSGDGSGPSAPQLAARYLGLGKQMNIATRAFVNDPTRVEPLNRLANKVVVSPYLQEVDAFFKAPTARRKWDGVRDVLAGYTTGANKNALRTGDANVEFLRPNAKVNEQLNSQ